MTGSPWTLTLPALTLVGVLAACGGDHPPPARDTTAAAGPADSSAPPAAAAGPTRVEGFQTPESVKYDPDLDVWYVANINGSPNAKGRQRVHLRLRAMAA
jgi:hypothetical protein